MAQIFGAAVTINDPTKPTVSDLKETGLAHARLVGGDEPVTFDAADSSGIKRAELWTSPTRARPKVVGQQAFTCDYSYAAPARRPPARRSRRARRSPPGRISSRCGSPTRATTSPTRRVHGRRGRAGERFRGRSAGEADRRVRAQQARTLIEVAFGKRAGIRGKLTTAAGAPIAGATIQVLDRRAAHRDAAMPQRVEVTTGADGQLQRRCRAGRRARGSGSSTGARRLLPRPDVAGPGRAARAAGSTLSHQAHAVRRAAGSGSRAGCSGLPLPRSGKLVDLQAFESGKWRTFDTTRARRAARASRSTYRFLRAGRGALVPDPRPDPARRLLPVLPRLLAAGTGQGPVAREQQRPAPHPGPAASAFSGPSHSPPRSQRPAMSRREARTPPASQRDGLEGRAARRVLLRRHPPARGANRPTAAAAHPAGRAARDHRPAAGGRRARVPRPRRWGRATSGRACRPQAGRVRAVGGEDDRPPAAQGQLARRRSARRRGAGRRPPRPGARRRRRGTGRAPSRPRGARCGRSRGPGPGLVEQPVLQPAPPARAGIARPRRPEARRRPPTG